jgi:hypothetical protein
MENFIQLYNNGYTVQINLKNIDNNDIPDLLNMLQENEFNWYNFCTNSDLWYCDGNKKLSCIGEFGIQKLIIFA